MKPLVVFFLLLLCFASITTTSARFLFKQCQGSNYTSNSTFKSNLDHLLKTLLNSPNSTFFPKTQGSGEDRAYTLALCRGDISPSDCEDCLRFATGDIFRRCPFHRQAITWYDECQLRFSDENFFSRFDNSGVREQLMFSKEKFNYPNGYVRDMMSQLSNKAEFNETLLMFATGRVMNVARAAVLYGLVQCTRDLSGNECGKCLKELLDVFYGKHEGVDGGMILGMSCNFRYEVSTFYQGKATITLNMSSSDQGEGKNKITVSILVILVIISLFYICFWGRRSTNNVSGMFKYFRLEEISSIESIFDLSIIKAATSDFSDANKLGEGGFGTVYKGTLPNGEDIAVKRLSARAEQGLLELKNELLLVVKLQHKNLVRLRGICLEEEEKLLVYEFVPNRSLDTILFDPIKSGDLNWEMRFKIIEGIARGLRYLHEESHLKVVHRDLKASNVLLNGDMNPKISDFGLAKLFKGDDSHVTTSRVAGTLGYMPPEYFRQGKFSAKFDIFSFGVLVLEIVTGKKISSFYDSEYAEDLLSYTWDHWKNGTLSEIIDSSLGEHYPINEVSKCIQIGLLCAQVVPADRPFMSSVMLMLHSPLETLKLPLQPTSSAGMHQLYTPRKQSGNEVSISEVHPR